MSLPGHSPHRVKRVVLPSGKTIEVVYFGEEGVPEERHASPAHDLHVCRECGSRLVYPTDWSEAGPKHWEVDLRCPNCSWTGGGVYAQEVVERFDQELDVGTEALVDDLKRLMRSNMEEEIERFVGALHADQILPEDF